MTCWPIDVHPVTTYRAKLHARTEEDSPEEMLDYFYTLLTNATSIHEEGGEEFPF
jgi:hypothetical protein